MRVCGIETKGLPETVKSLLISAKIPLMQYRTLPLTELCASQFWEEYVDAEIVFLDHRHWLYDDETFFKYARIISSIPFKALAIFESPFGYESQNSYRHDEKVYRRTKTLVDLVKSKQKTIIVSPSIRLVSHEVERKYIDYFIKYRSLFDVYSVQMCTCTTDQDVGAVCSLTKQVLDILRKPVWVTKWAVPSCELQISNSKMINPVSWKPLTHVSAANRMRFMYDTIRSITTDVKWFYLLGSDLYCDDAFPPDNYSDDIPYRADSKSDWGLHHFLGIIDYHSNIKLPILEMLKKLLKDVL